MPRLLRLLVLAPHRGLNLRPTSVLHRDYHCVPVSKEHNQMERRPNLAPACRRGDCRLRHLLQISTTVGSLGLAD